MWAGSDPASPDALILFMVRKKLMAAEAISLKCPNLPERPSPTATNPPGMNEPIYIFPPELFPGVVAMVVQRFPNRGGRLYVSAHATVRPPRSESVIFPRANLEDQRHRKPTA